MQTHITTQSYTIYSITLILFPSFTHTLADRSCTHTAMRARIFLLPRNQSLTQIQLPVFPWRSQSFSHATPRRRSEGGHFLPKSSSILSLHHEFELVLFISASLPSLFISEEIIRAGKEKKKTTCKLQKQRHRKGVGEGRGEAAFFLKYVVFSFFLGPLSLAVLSLLRLSGFQMDAFWHSKQKAWKRKSTNRWERVEKAGKGGCR